MFDEEPSCSRKMVIQFLLRCHGPWRLICTWPHGKHGVLSSSSQWRKQSHRSLQSSKEVSEAQVEWPKQVRRFPNAVWYQYQVKVYRQCISALSLGHNHSVLKKATHSSMYVHDKCPESLCTFSPDTNLHSSVSGIATADYNTLIMFRL